MTETSESPGPRPGETTMQFLGGLLRDWGLAMVVVVIVFLGYSMLFGPAAPKVGQAPDFTLVDLDGRRTTLSDVDAEVVVLNFWFTDCPPCRAEIPELTAFAKAHPDVALYGVSTDLNMPRKRLAAESARLGVGYPVLHDVRADVARTYGVSVFPTTVVIKDMEIVASKLGAVDRTQLERLLDH